MYKLQNLQIFQKYRESRDFCDWGIPRLKNTNLKSKGLKLLEESNFKVEF